MLGRDVTRTQRTRRSQRRPVSALLSYVLAFVSLVSFVLILPPIRLVAARPGSIRGHVELKRPAAAIERRPGVADLGTPAGRDVPDLLRSVVYLESAPRGAFETSEGGRAVMDQRNETFVPHVLAITTGTTVDFPNSDKFYHNVFSLSKTRPFDLGRYAAGNSRPIRFDRAGIIRVFCDIHSHMNAFILVFSHPFFSLTDIDGRFRIDNVPPGTYNLVAWNEGVSSEPKAVTVPDGGEAELDFMLR
jgi:plastocyanin